MNAIQKVIWTLGCLALIAGTFVLSLIPSADLGSIFLYIVAVLLSTFLMSNAFRTNRHVQKTSPAEASPVPLVNPVFMKIESFWPFEFFPSSLIVNEDAITVVKKLFFFTGWTESIPVSDIVAVTMYRGPFFATIAVQKKSTKEEIRIRYLKKNEALQAKELIDGLILKNQGLITVPEKASVPTRKEMIKQAGKNPEAQKEILEKAL